MADSAHHENAFEVLFEMSVDMLCIAGTDGYLKTVNPAFQATLGYSEQELLSTPFFDFVHPDDVAATRAELDKLAAGGPSITFENRYRGRDGRYRVLAWSGRADPAKGLVYAVARDVTAAREANSNFVQLHRVLTSEAIVASTDPAGRLIEVNDKFCEISGYSREELIGETPGLLKSGAHGGDFFRAMWGAISAGRSWSGLIENRRKTGEAYHVQSIITPIVDLAGETQRFLTVQFDVTPQIRSLEALKKAQSILNEVEAIATIGGWELDIATDRLDWTDQTFKIFEVEKIDGVQLALSDGLALFTDKSKPLIEAAVKRAIEQGVPYSLELVALTAKGNTRWVQTNGQPHYQNGAIAYLSGTVQDINDRKLAELELLKSEKKYRSIVEGSQDLINVLGPDGRFQFTNHASNTIYGTPPEACIGLTYDAFIHPDDLEDTVAAVEGWIREARTTATYSNRQVSTDGTVRDIAWNIALHYGGDGALETLIAIGRDVTERKRLDDELNRALAEAKRANQAKSEFLASMSHELRTPLNAILGFSEILTGAPLGPALEGRYREYAGDIHKSGVHLLELVNDLLDISSIEAGKTVLSKEPLAAAAVVAECLRVMTPKSHEKNIRLINRASGGRPTLLADRRAINQILLNLLSNAVKFTPEGGEVAVSTACEAGWFHLTVADTGPGIDPAVLDDVLKPFVTGSSDPYKTDPYKAEQGWGLGLSIAQSLAALHDGDIVIESRPGEGAAITLRLPAP